jgi:hypothetical protein
MRSTPIITGLLLVAPPVSVLGFAALLLWLSGDWRWVEGLGASLVFVGGALLLGSISGLLLGLAMVVLIVVRIFGEEKLLARDLEGYKEYLQKVRYGWYHMSGDHPVSGFPLSIRQVRVRRFSEKRRSRKLAGRQHRPAVGSGKPTYQGSGPPGVFAQEC